MVLQTCNIVSVTSLVTTEQLVLMTETEAFVAFVLGNLGEKRVFFHLLLELQLHDLHHLVI